MTNEEVDGVAARWRKFRFLRELYLDESVAEEFMEFRRKFVSILAAEERVAIVKPGVTTSRKASTGDLQSQPYGYDFKERFHHALCSNTMAVASHQLGKACRETLVLKDGKLEDAYPDGDVLAAVDDFWVRARWNSSAEDDDAEDDDADRSRRAKPEADQMEIFDFLYMFLLRKVVPFEKFAAWTEADAQHWSEERACTIDEEDDDEPIDVQKWHTFLSDCRKSIRPMDLVDLIKGTADADYPPDKSMYLQVRGVFDGGQTERVEWCSYYERAPIVFRLLPYNDRVFAVNKTELPSWWDRVRLVSGSPFAEVSHSSLIHTNS